MSYKFREIIGRIMTCCRCCIQKATHYRCLLCYEQTLCEECNGGNGMMIDYDAEKRHQKDCPQCSVELVD